MPIEPHLWAGRFEFPVHRHRRRRLVETSLIWIYINISFWRADAFFSPTAALEHFLPLVVSGCMNVEKNPNWQDKLLGGAILTGFVMVAIIAVVFTVVTSASGRHTASSTTIHSCVQTGASFYE
jgi:hypothetical protein